MPLRAFFELFLTVFADSVNGRNSGSSRIFLFSVNEKCIRNQSGIYNPGLFSTFSVKRVLEIFILIQCKLSCFSVPY